jgi:3-deoxy-manno-octulosonate cytidylyltransferase (CMP-KDO synthetase)
VATAFGMLVALAPGLVGCAFAVFVTLFALTNYISLGSCGAAAFIAAAVWFTPAGAAAKVIISLIGLFVIVKHRSNIVRLVRGNENKIYIFKKSVKVYGIIPSRFGSSRFPGKPLAELAGKPLVAWVVEAAKKAASLDEVLVATDDERIVEAVEKHGGRAVMTPSELPSGTDRIAAAAGNFADGDILVNIQGDEPLIDPALIDRLVEKLKTDRRWSMATAVTPIRSAEDLAAKTVVKVVLDREDGALYFSRAPIPCDRDHDADLAGGLYVRHLGIYAYRGAFLRRYIKEPQCALEKTECLEQLRALWMGERIAVVRPDDEGVGVDTPEDAERVGKLLAERMRREA